MVQPLVFMLHDVYDLDRGYTCYMIILLQA